MNVSTDSIHSKPEATDLIILTSEQDAIAAAEAFAARIRPGAAERDAAHARPIAEIQDLCRTGLLGITVPRAYGGLETSVRTLVKVFHLISAADPAIGQIPQSHFSHLENLRALGSDAQKNYFYADVLNGGLWGNALSERETTGGLGNIQSRIRRTGGGTYLINGRKYYTTGALYARWIPVSVRDDEDRVCMVLVERHAPGVEIIDDWNCMGQRGTASGTATFTDVAVRDEQIVPIWRMTTAPTTRRAFGQIMHIAIDIGIADEALSDTIQYIRTRSRGWHVANLSAAGDDPHVIRRIGELKVQIEAAKALLYHAADTFDATSAGEPSENAIVDMAMIVSAAKAACSAVAVQVSSDLFALTGTSAADEKWNLNRHWRNARTHTLHDPEAWKYYYIGDYHLNGRRPPRGALIA